MISKKNNKVALFFYYLLLLLVLTSWTNVDASPPIFIRIIFLGALFIPLIKNVELTPFVLTTFLTISQYGFAYSYMPTDLYIYLFLILSFYILVRRKLRHNKSNIKKIFIFTASYIILIDLLYHFKIEDIGFAILVVITLSGFINFKKLKEINYLSYAFIIATSVLSLYIIFYGRDFMQDYYTTGGITIERTGWTDPNYFGTVIGMGTVNAILQIIKYPRKSLPNMIFLIFTILISLIALSLIASRGAILAVGGSVLFLIIFANMKFKYKVLYSILIISITAFLYSNNYFELLLYRVVADDGTGSGRSTIWITKLNAFANESSMLQLLFGHGFHNGFRLGYNKPQGFHNEFIAILVNYGVIGFFIFSYLLLLPVKIAPHKSKATITALILYLVLTFATLEPITAGRIPYFIYYLYIYCLAKFFRINHITTHYYNEKKLTFHNT